MANSSSALLSCRFMALINFPATSLSPHSCTVGPFTSVVIFGVPGCVVLCRINCFLFSCFCVPSNSRSCAMLTNFAYLQVNGTLLWLIESSSLALGSQLVPDTASIVPFQMLAWTVTMSCFSTLQLASVLWSELWVFCQSPIPYLATYFRRSHQTTSVAPLFRTLAVLVK